MATIPPFPDICSIYRPFNSVTPTVLIQPCRIVPDLARGRGASVGGNYLQWDHWVDLPAGVDIKDNVTRDVATWIVSYTDGDEVLATYNGVNEKYVVVWVEQRYTDTGASWQRAYLRRDLSTRTSSSTSSGTGTGTSTSSSTSSGTGTSTSTGTSSGTTSSSGTGSSSGTSSSGGSGSSSSSGTTTSSGTGTGAAACASCPAGGTPSHIDMTLSGFGGAGFAGAGSQANIGAVSCPQDTTPCVWLKHQGAALANVYRSGSTFSLLVYLDGDPSSAAFTFGGGAALCLGANTLPAAYTAPGYTGPSSITITGVP